MRTATECVRGTKSKILRADSQQSTIFAASKNDDSIIRYFEQLNGQTIQK
jgi:hypothetical protein